MIRTSGLPGLQRLIEVCRRLDLKVELAPPSRTPPSVVTLIAGLPFDAILAAVYAQIGFGAFATDQAGIIVRRYDDTARKVEEDNAWWSQGYRRQLALPTFLFAAEPLSAYHYATIPILADEQGRQPVVMVDVNEEPYALPVASSVDGFFEAYSRYLEALMALRDGREEKETLLTFPWDIPEIIGRDAALVQGLRLGSFAPIMKTAGSTPAWAAQVLEAHER